MTSATRVPKLRSIEGGLDAAWDAALISILRDPLNPRAFDPIEALIASTARKADLVDVSVPSASEAQSPPANER